MGQVLLRNITLAMLVLRMMMLRTMLGALLSKGVFPWNALALPYFDAAWSFIYNHSILALFSSITYLPTMPNYISDGQAVESPPPSPPTQNANDNYFPSPALAW